MYGFGDGVGVGNGDVTGSLAPSLISHVAGLPISKIACGEAHSMALSVSGSIWCWGSNGFGCLADANSPDTYRPNMIRLSTTAVDIAAGSFHCLALTNGGQVLSWGKNNDGQLGYDCGGPINSVPRIISELLGTHVDRISAGRKASFFVASGGRVYACGARQAIGGAVKATSPTHVPVLVSELTGCQDVVAGSLAAFAVFGSPLQQHQQRVFHFDESIAAPLLLSDLEPVSANQIVDVVRMLENSFSCVAAVNGSFLDPVRHWATNVEETPGVDFSRAISCLHRLDKLGGKPVVEAMEMAWSRLIRNSLDSVATTKSPECLRVWLLAFANPSMQRPQTYNFLIDRFLVSLVGLGKRSCATVEGWWKNLPFDLYMFIVDTIQRYVSFLVTNQPGSTKYATAAIVLDRLHSVREVPPTSFYNTTLSNSINLVNEIHNYGGAVFSWLNYPYLLNAEAKSVRMHLLTFVLLL
jgi:E3 ubiquitin-protein ligase HERC3